MAMTPFEIGASLIGAGFSVFPFSDDGTKPRTSAWSRVATRSPARLKLWCSTAQPPWRATPLAPVVNFGISLDRFRYRHVSLMALEAIGDVGERTFERMSRNWGLPHGVRIGSPGGDTSFYLFTTTVRLCSSVRKLGPELRVRAGVNFVPAPGCTTRKGAWHCDAVAAPAEAPRILIDAFLESPKAGW
jgi:hypothetical protein